MLHRLTSLSLGANGIVRVSPIEDDPAVDSDEEYFDLETGAKNSFEQIMPRLPLEQVVRQVNETPPGTGSTKCPGTSGRRRKPRQNSNKRKYERQLFSPGGQSLADRISRNQGIIKQINAVPPVEDTKINSVTAGLGKRLSLRRQEKFVEIVPTRPKTDIAALQEKQRRAARRREANRLARLAKADVVADHD